MGSVLMNRQWMSRFSYYNFSLRHSRRLRRSFLSKESNQRKVAAWFRPMKGSGVSVPVPPVRYAMPHFLLIVPSLRLSCLNRDFWDYKIYVIDVYRVLPVSKTASGESG